MQWNLNRGGVVCLGNKKPHKYLRTFSPKTGYTNILKNLEKQSHSSLGGQHDSFDISVKDGGTKNLKLVQLAKEIWDHILQRGIALTAEYLPSKLNLITDWESRNNSDSSELKLAPQSFQRICQLRETLEIDLFAFRLSHQIKTYFFYKPDLLSQVVDAFQGIGSTRVFMLFPHFA